MKKIIFILLIAASALLLLGCDFVQPASITSSGSNFWDGIWHGLLAPYTLIVRLFTEVGMYDINNTGWWYDFGFLLGLCCALPAGIFALIITLII